MTKYFDRALLLQWLQKTYRLSGDSFNVHVLRVIYGIESSARTNVIFSNIFMSYWRPSHEPTEYYLRYGYREMDAIKLFQLSRAKPLSL